MSDQKPVNKMKPRSGLVTDGLERAPARGMLRAVGFKDEDFAKARIGIASSWNEITPCNLSLDRLAKASKKGVIEAGGFPMQFGTISVSDGVSMGHEGMHFSLVSREVIADSVEAVMQAERLDGMVTFAGCDKSLPGMMMAAARLDVASVFVYAGSIMPGKVDGRDVTIIDAFEAVGACARGLISEAEVDKIERAICPGEGACGGMYTAKTMAANGEAIGLSPPGSASPPSIDRRRDDYAIKSGAAVVEGLMLGKFRNTGQVCVSPNRIYVQEKIYDNFIKKVVEVIKKLKMGDGLKEETQLGPLIDDTAIAKVEEHIKDAVEKGATIELGGKRHALGGRFYEATVLANVNKSMKLANEETFGPVAPFFKFKTCGWLYFCN